MAYSIGKLSLIDDRNAFLLRACEQKSVLHLGCAQWPVTAEGLRDGSLLHVGLSKVARRVCGVDLSGEGLGLLRAHGFTDLVRGNVEALDELPISLPVDVIVAGEILEHLANPGLCVQAIARFMQKSPACRLIVTVPNAYSLRHFVSCMFRNTELVMPDHTAYYSFSTISELLRRYGLAVGEFHASSELHNRSSALKRSVKLVMNSTLLRAFPQISEGIIAVAELSAASRRDAVVGG